jgi:3-oxoacyl-[acyl-carrier-protein] synthase II
LALTGWSAVSPLGLGARTFSEGMRDGLTGVRSYDEPGPAGMTRVATVPGFDIREVLGSKNTRSMDRATALAVATVGMLLEGGIEGDGRNVGLVLGTTTGSVQSMMDFTRDSLTEDKPFLVNPAKFPNTVMNCAAGQCAIWHGLRGPNTTIAGGHATGLAALNYAARLHHSGHAETVLCGAVEEFSPQRAWLECHARSEDGTAPVLGEGCAVFLMESPQTARQAGRAVLAELLAVDLRVYDADLSGGLTQSVRAGLAAARVAADEVWAVAGDEASAAAIDEVFAAGSPRRIGVEEAIGDTGAASATMRLAAVLAAAGHDQDARGRAALVTSVDRDGLLGCTVLRLSGSPVARP